MAPIKHGAYVNGKPTKLYRIWLSMRGRCVNPNHSGYQWYGAKGVKVCERWDDFIKFRNDIGDAPGPGFSLDRFPDRNGNYEPGNVRWATAEQQANNKDCVRLLTLPDGRQMSIGMAARATGIYRLTLQNRINRGWRPDRLFVPPDATVGRFRKGENRNRYAK